MKNFPIEQEGKIYWVSRSMAAVAYIYGEIGGRVCVLANKRGRGLPNKVGKWNCPSGFLDYGETLKQCALREVFEETGVKTSETGLYMFDVDDDPKRESSNVLVRFCKKLYDAEYAILTTDFSEPDEVEDVKWIPLDEIDNYEWVSDRHKNLIVPTYNKYLNEK